MRHPYNVIPEEVFHYTKKDIGLEKILFEKKMKFGQLGFTNDPRETKERLFGFLSSRDYKDNQKNIADWIRREAIRIIQQEWKVACFSSHHPKLKPPRVSILDKHEVLNPNDGSSLYANPFMAGGYRPRMWAQYAENHRGICLKFNGKKLNDRIQQELGQKYKIFYGEVDYSNEGLLERFHVELSEFLETDSPSQLLREYMIDNYEQLFFRKAKDRETEYEFRWVIYGENNSAEFVSVDGIVEEVLVGIDFPKAYEPSLIAVCKELDIPAGRMVWINGIPYLEPEIIYRP
jgi:hypothetical protein